VTKLIVNKFLILFALITFSHTAFAGNTVHVIAHDTSFEDIRLSIENEIIGNGFVIDFNGNISRMLENTVNVADDSTQLYRHAEFWQFCSSQITRKLTNIDPINVAYCPFVVFAFELVSQPGAVTIGYRPLSMNTSQQTNAIVVEINDLLENIVFNAAQ